MLRTVSTLQAERTAQPTRAIALRSSGIDGGFAVRRKVKVSVQHRQPAHKFFAAGPKAKSSERRHTGIGVGVASLAVANAGVAFRSG